MILIESVQHKKLLIQGLLAAAAAERFEFVGRLVTEFNDGRNRFDRPGEILLRVIEDDYLIGVGGLNRDPYLPKQNAGRVRHVYILPDFRDRGVGRQLVNAIIDHGRDHFDLLTLRTLTPAAAAFYTTLGFKGAGDLPGATHLRLY